MGKIPVCFYRKLKFRRSNGMPVFNCTIQRHPVKCIINLNGIKMFGIIDQPFLFRQIVGIKQTSPVIIIIARTAYMNFHWYNLFLPGIRLRTVSSFYYSLENSRRKPCCFLELVREVCNAAVIHFPGNLCTGKLFFNYKFFYPFNSL